CVAWSPPGLVGDCFAVNFTLAGIIALREAVAVPSRRRGAPFTRGIPMPIFQPPPTGDCSIQELLGENNETFPSACRGARRRGRVCAGDRRCRCTPTHQRGF